MQVIIFGVNSIGCYKGIKILNLQNDSLMLLNWLKVNMVAWFKKLYV
jgi:hypothetical protein